MPRLMAQSMQISMTIEDGVYSSLCDVFYRSNTCYDAMCIQIFGYVMFKSGNGSEFVLLLFSHEHTYVEIVLHFLLRDGEQYIA
jgi:hypothetical protein